jgi:hypothetical protein
VQLLTPEERSAPHLSRLRLSLLALLVQKDLLTSTKVQVLTPEERSGPHRRRARLSLLTLLVQKCKY